MDISKILSKYPLTILLSVMGGWAGNMPGSIVCGFIGLTMDSFFGRK